MSGRSVRPMGPWILIKADPPPTMRGSLYLPQGNMDERLGNATGVVLAVGQGKRSTAKQYKRTGLKYQPIDLEPGMAVMFRGFLQESNRPGGQLDTEHSLIHMDDIIGEVTD